MIKTIADACREEGREQGREQGRLEGLRDLLTKLIALRFSNKSEQDIRQLLEAVTEEKKLEEIGARLMTESPSWDELWT